MAEAVTAFASYLRFQEIIADPLGHLYRAGEYDSSGVKRPVWLRVFDGPMVPAADLISGFERTQKIAAAVQSANLATGIDCVVSDGQPAIATDYVSSQPLNLVFERVVTEQFPIPVDNALLILEKIALALASTLTVEIDGQRIVHGFLHPGLVFVTYDGEGMVTGFGVGDHLLALVDDVPSADLIHPYLAPEVIVARTPSRHADVYSLGAILFQLLTGSRLPTKTDERQQAINDAQIAHDEVPVPDDIGVLLKRALAERPEDRFSSAADLKKELDRLLYGGAYSPTTFNLALFMDRLFRAEIEAEEGQRAVEMALDVTPFLESAIEAEPDPLIEPAMDGGTAAGLGKRLWIGIAAAVVIVVASTIFMVTRGPETPPPSPTPTAAEMAAQRQAQDQKIRELAEGLVSEMMAEKEEEIREELLDRQTKIEELQKRLQASERRARQGQLSSDEQRRREELQRQIAAEEEAQRQRETELEAERQQAAAQQTATAAAEEEARLAASLTPTTTTAAPAEAPTPQVTAVTSPEATIQENSFVDPSETDSLPVVIKHAPVAWPQSALRSRRNGVVIVQATVDATGKVVAVKVLRADDDGFGIPEAVLDAARNYRFKPGTKGGVPITTYATVTKAYRFVVR